jgi:glycosyltransferase involved in cell wall biosynthesis
MNSPDICIISTSARMLWLFYRDMIKACHEKVGNTAVITAEMPELDMLRTYTGCICKIIPLKRNISLVNDITTIARLYCFFSKNKIKLVHSHTPKGGLIAMISAFLANVPSRIYTAHGLPCETAKGIKRAVLEFADRITCKCANYVLAVSPSLKQSMIEHGICSASKIKVLSNGSACGINFNYFNNDECFKKYRVQMREKFDIDESAVVFGFVGRFGPEKGGEELIRAFLKLSEIRNVFLLIVGEPETLHGSINSEIHKILADNTKIFFENRHIVDIKQYYAAMDAVVLPSWREGFGMSLAEAGALGIATIASDSTGCKDIIENGKTGLLFEKKNSEELFEAMLKICDNKELRLEFGTSAKMRIKKKFDSEVLIEQHLNFYGRLLHNEQ